MCNNCDSISINISFLCVPPHYLHLLLRLPRLLWTSVLLFSLQHFDSLLQRGLALPSQLWSLPLRRSFHHRQTIGTRTGGTGWGEPGVWPVWMDKVHKTTQKYNDCKIMHNLDVWQRNGYIRIMNMIIIFRLIQWKKRGCLVISIQTEFVSDAFLWSHPDLCTLWQRVKSATSTALSCLCVWLDVGLLVNATPEDRRVWAWVWSKRGHGVLCVLLSLQPQHFHTSVSSCDATRYKCIAIVKLPLALFMVAKSVSARFSTLWLLNLFLLWSVRLIQRKMLCGSFIGTDLSITLN